jgi:hypothetical protein
VTCKIIEIFSQLVKRLGKVFFGGNAGIVGFVGEDEKKNYFIV